MQTHPHCLLKGRQNKGFRLCTCSCCDVTFSSLQLGLDLVLELWVFFLNVFLFDQTWNTSVFNDATTCFVERERERARGKERRRERWESVCVYVCLFVCVYFLHDSGWGFRCSLSSTPLLSLPKDRTQNFLKIYFSGLTTNHHERKRNGIITWANSRKLKVFKK